MIRLQIVNGTLTNSDRAQHTPKISTGSCSNHELWLPCPAESILELVIASGLPAADGRGIFHRVFRLNPSLLLWALNRYRLANDRPAKSPRKLVRWCHKELLDDLAAQPLADDNRSVAQPRKSSRVLTKFFQVRSRGKCAGSLGQWLKCHSDLNQAQRQSWLQQVIGPKFRLDRFRVRGVRRESTQKETLRLWLNRPRTEYRLRQLIEISSQARQQANEFKRRLTRDKLAAMKQLAYGASHEINNPLANVATRAQALLIDEQHPERRNTLAMIYQQAMRAHEMISDLMLFAHPPQTEVETFGLRELMQPLLSQWPPSAVVADSTTLQCFVGPGIDRLQADRTQFLVVLDSLIQNSAEAILAREGDGQIELRFNLLDWNDKRLPRDLRRPEIDTWCQVSIWDNGIGVDDRVGQHLFDPFFSGREAGRGLGFGLSKCWRIVEQHGGQMRLDDACVEGTRFVFWLPQLSGLKSSRRQAGELRASS